MKKCWLFVNAVSTFINFAGVNHDAPRVWTPCFTKGEPVLQGCLGGYAFHSSVFASVWDLSKEYIVLSQYVSSWRAI